jgi:hypothetical protein
VLLFNIYSSTTTVIIRENENMVCFQLSSMNCLSNWFDCTRSAEENYKQGFHLTAKNSAALKIAVICLER